MPTHTEIQDRNKLNHNEPGGIRGSHIGADQQGITNHPQEESERQTKVVQDREKETSTS